MSNETNKLTFDHFKVRFLDEVHADYLSVITQSFLLRKVMDDLLKSAPSKIVQSAPSYNKGHVFAKKIFILCF